MDAHVESQALPEQESDYEEMQTQGTGAHSLATEAIVLKYPFDRYEVGVLVSQSGEFLGITEISVNKDFLAHVQRLVALGGLGYHDVDEFYKDSDDE